MTQHSEKYFEQKYAELQQYAEAKNIEFPYWNIEEFKSDYMDVLGQGSKNVMKDIKYNMQYETSYKTALAEKRALKEELDIDVKLQDLQIMSTREFADNHLDELEAAYDKLRASGKSPLGAKLAISRYWFGSD
jgi:hypothetical protein